MGAVAGKALSAGRPEAGAEPDAYVPGVPVGGVIGLCSAVLTGAVNEVYCHRCLAHRAFRVHPRLASALDTYFRGDRPETPKPGPPCTACSTATPTRRSTLTRPTAAGGTVALSGGRTTSDVRAE
jgi:hypothetical protein